MYEERFHEHEKRRVCGGGGTLRFPLCAQHELFCWWYYIYKYICLYLVFSSGLVVHAAHAVHICAEWCLQSSRGSFNIAIATGNFDLEWMRVWSWRQYMMFCNSDNIDPRPTCFLFVLSEASALLPIFIIS